MGIPQYIMLILLAIDLLVSSNKHGQSKGEYNFVHSLLSAIIVFTLLYTGGFFDNK